MGRKKIDIKIIEDDRKRASTFEKRRIGLFKKASELNRLCGVHISVIIVNKDSVYTFSEPSDELFKPFLNNKHHKTQENFNNDSLMELINKKPNRIRTNTESSSIDCQSTCEKHNSALTDDDDDFGPEFTDVLRQTNLLVPFNEIRTDLESDGFDNCRDNKSASAAALRSFNFVPNDQTCSSSFNKVIPIPPINNVRIIHEEPPQNALSTYFRPEIGSIRDFQLISTTDDGYLYNSSILEEFTDHSSVIINNSIWQTHKSNNPQNSELRFERNPQNDISSINSLNTPTLEFSTNINSVHNFNNNSQYFIRDRDTPKSKRLKMFNDCQETIYSQQQAS